ncbi:DUF1345 domain-containing protein [Naumannella huperziae]
MRLPTRFGVRLAVMVVIGIVVGLAGWLIVRTPAVAVLCGVSVLSVGMIIWSLAQRWGLNSEQTKEVARAEPIDAGMQELLIAIVAIGSFAGILALLVLNQLPGRHIASVVGLIGVFASWAMLHAMYAECYARIYYLDPHGGLDFNDDAAPMFSDFYYFAFTIGMTFAVSDDSVTDNAVRRLVLRHGLLSFLFGALILGAVINLVTSAAT